MRKISFLLTISIAFLSSCDSYIPLNTTRGDNNKIIEISGNLINSVGSSIVRIPFTNNIPQDILNSEQIEIAFDNSKSLYPVIKNADNSLSFTVPSSIKISSAGKIKAFFVIKNQKSYFVNINTGPIFKLNNPGIIVKPANGIIVKGEKVYLTANLPNDKNKDDYIFNWFYTTTGTAPYLPINGTSINADWIPNSVGNYFIKLDIIDKKTGITSSYTTPSSIVFVTENDNIIKTNPDNGKIVKGNSIILEANSPNIQENTTYSWSYSTSSQSGVWRPISGNSKIVKWTPTESGSFFIKVDVANPNSEVQSFISPKAIVFVSENNDIFQTEPLNGSINLGQYVNIKANISFLEGNNQYIWSYSNSGLPGTFRNMTNIKTDISSPSIRWRVPEEGSFFVKLDVINSQNSSVLSFQSSNPIVFVTEKLPLFETNPKDGKILPDSTIEISTNVENIMNGSYVWSYGVSQSGPWTAIGGSISKTIKWEKQGKPTGTFYVKLDITDDSTDKRVTTFISKNPIIFIEKQSSTNNSNTFGMN
ncbi:MAG: hypothetical protein KatS3mg068_1097 [Candidatus Sericytochromatia bacterium]|nr:MAG: hypothetical protein KatS3mg068_1097 [Candidatus Sericytochromatia bacterium]